jgi:hypothetical protein
MKAVFACSALALAFAMATTPADAKGCIKGAVVGGIAGHYAGHHALLGRRRAVSSAITRLRNASGRRKTPRPSRRIEDSLTPKIV